MPRHGNGICFVFVFGVWKLWQINKLALANRSTQPLLCPAHRMRISSLLAPLVSLTLATLAIAEAASDVIDLTPSNFKSVVDPEKIILVEFFAPWYTLFVLRVSLQEHKANTRSSLKVRALQGACSQLRGSGHLPQRKGHQARQSELR